MIYNIVYALTASGLGNESMSIGMTSSQVSARDVARPPTSEGRGWPTELGALTGLTTSNCCCKGGNGDLCVYVFLNFMELSLTCDICYPWTMCFGLRKLKL